MRTKTVKRHFCDHCNKGMFKKKSMERHESICFYNPQRSACILCDLHKEKTELPVVLDDAYKISLDALRTAANHCPACIFSAIIRDYKRNPREDEPEVGWVDKREGDDFIYANEVRIWNGKDFTFED